MSEGQNQNVRTLTIDPAHTALDIFADPITKDVWRDKYRWGDEASPFESMSRVARGVYAHDLKDGHLELAEKAMHQGLWVPGGRIHAGAGTPKAVTLINCYVDRTIEDAMTGIADALKDAMLTMQQGGGIGMDFSTLRPSGAYLQRTGAVASGPLPFMDMWNSMCSTIMSAGSRRGAMMGVMHIEHPDIIKFIEAKHEKDRLTNFNVSVLVTDAFMQCVQDDEEWHLGFHVPRADKVHLGVMEREDVPGGKWYVYQIIKARELWDKIIQSTYEYAEPGVIFIDRINEQNNLAYCETISCTNPCVTGDTLILTDIGHIRIKDLVAQPTKVWNGKKFSEVVPFSTGVNSLVEVKLSNGATIRATDYHRWKLSNGDVVETKYLRAKDKLAYMDMPVIDFGTTFNVDAYSQGFYSGDGTKNSDYSNLYKHDEGIRNRLVGKIYDRNCESSPGHRWVHGKMLPKDFVPINGNIEYRVNWLAGLLDADGCVSKKKETNVLEISAKDRIFLHKVGLLLNTLGINFRMWERSDAGLKTGSNGKSYQCESTAALMISHKGAHQLVKLGLSCERVNLEYFQKAPKGIARVGHRVVSVTPLEQQEETFCFTEPEEHMGVFNGIPAMNCGEQPLPPNGACNLGAVNLARMVRSPFTGEAAFDFELLRQVVKIGVRFLDNVIDVTNYPLEAQAIEETTKRRIGLGITGLANALAQLRIRYGSMAALDITNGIMDTIKNTAYETSAELAKERGSFPLYSPSNWGKNSPVVASLDPSVQELIDTHGIRNGVLLTIAPTGTTSLYMGNVSSGLEPVFLHQLTRKVRQPDNSYKDYECFDYGMKLYQSVNPKWNEQGKPPYMVTTQDLTVADHVRMQAVCQQHIDASVSKTINCPKDITFEEFQLVYWDAYQRGCKGCTTYRPSDVRGSILSDGKEEKPSQPIDLSQRIRPESLRGTTYKVHWPNADANYYITINDHDGKPYEVFIHSTSSKYSEWTTALSLLVSALMRAGEDISFVPRELQKVVSTHDYAWIGGKLKGSLPAMIGETLQKHLTYVDFRTVDEGRVKYTVEQLTDEEALEIRTTTTGRMHSISQVRGEICPKCNLPTYVFQEGCKACLSCGHSTCG